APDEKLIFFIGRLVHEKGAHVLVDAVPKILHYWDKAKVVIAGKGPQDAYLKDRARELGVFNRIYFTGFIDDETRSKLYRCADVAVFPSLYEPFGITALEAMAAGVPVVVSDVGGLGEVVRHGLTGWKVYPGDPNSLADGILHLLHEPDLAQKLKDNALKIVRSRYDWQAIAEDTVKVYREVLNEYRESDWARQVNREAHILASRDNGWRQRHEASAPYM
ncbi:MAG TPA: glycosyltransferase family 4 protein, partial [Firmicutes bacterium]|nr:glycosyltransferase family 4 protein [Bacillota bacterium]